MSSTPARDAGDTRLSTEMPVFDAPSATPTPPVESTTSPASPSGKQGDRRKYDRSIIDGPLGPAVWRLAWPTMLVNVIGGIQGMIDHLLVGNMVGYKGNAAIGVSWQIFLVVIVF